MSTGSHPHAAGESAFVHGSEHAAADLPHATLKGYLTGFFLSVVLTVIPFWLVMGDVLDNRTFTILLILVLGVAQILVHVVYFLHMNSRGRRLEFNGAGLHAGAGSDCAGWLDLDYVQRQRQYDAHVAGLP